LSKRESQIEREQRKKRDPTTRGRQRVKERQQTIDRLSETGRKTEKRGG